ncbi:hypothetical protein ACETUS_27410 [Priestia megaterium]
MRMLEGKVVTCRKPHRCIWCGESIEKWEKAAYRRYISDGEFVQDYWHMECYIAMMRSEDTMDEGFDAFEQKRGKILEESHDDLRITI